MTRNLVVVFNSKVVTTSEILDLGFVVIENGKIRDVRPNNFGLKEVENKYPGATFFDGAGKLLIPGLIDIHVHGGNGKGLMDCTEESLKELARTCLRGGTTGFLATTRAAEEQTLLKVFAVYKRFLAESDFAYKQAFLGIHMESPFINPIKRGGQAESSIRPIDLSEVKRYIDGLGKDLKILSYAPELSGGLSLTDYLVNQGITASIGHSNANFAEASAAFDRGINHINHCLNGMTGFHHRQPGILGAALDRQDLWVEVICDGYHLHPQTIRMLYLLFGADKIILITDRTEAAGLPVGYHTIQGRQLQVTERGEIIEPGRNIYSGSSLSMNRALLNFRSMAKVSLVEAVKAASLNPARLLGLAHRKGSIEVGKDGDLVLMNDNGTVEWTMLQGEICQLQPKTRN